MWIRDLICAVALLVIVLWGVAFIDWLDPGRVNARITANFENCIAHAVGDHEMELCAARFRPELLED